IVCAQLGYALAPNWATMVAIGLLSGIGAGAIDSAINAFAAHRFSHRVMNWLVDVLALVVPALDTWTQTAWLVDRPAAWTTIASLAGHSVVFVTVLAAAAVFDMHRKNL
ncbi:MAG: hypothetical protein ACXW2I_14175, partial [Burkholderiales bacterium]